MPAPNAHSRYIMEVVDSPFVRKGDIITFRYEGEERWALVLQPNWRSKMHAIDLALIDRAMLLAILANVYGQQPLTFYRTYLARSKRIKDQDAYRTFEVRKMSSIKQVVYDVGYNTANKYTFWNFGTSVFLGYNNNGVFAEQYPPLNGLLRTRAKLGLYVSSAPLPKKVVQFVRGLGLDPNFVSWKRVISSSSDTPQEQTAETIDKTYFDNLRAKGGVFFVNEEEFPLILNLLGAQ